MAGAVSVVSNDGLGVVNIGKSVLQNDVQATPADQSDRATIKPAFIMYCVHDHLSSALGYNI